MSRPPSDFHGFIGQNRIVAPLRRQIAGAKAYALPFPTTLVTGPSGVGKTHLAKAMAKEFGTQLFEVQGRNDAGTLLTKLHQLKLIRFSTDRRGASPASSPAGIATRCDR